ncbi:hypothetical protein ABID43_001353 [Methylobacterium goesingense]|uniref:OmpA-like domain-containing protein n=1 Tax=Methylobacterium goesingense TaxID=243690 RepID=A0ABV2L1W5_9HYPH
MHSMGGQRLARGKTRFTIVEWSDSIEFAWEQSPMLKPFDDPAGYFSFSPIPSKFFLDPPVFGGGGLLVLNKFKTNSASLSAQHGIGIKLAVAQVLTNFGRDQGNLELYGVTDRAGSETYNMTLSAARARSTLTAVKAALGLSEIHLCSSAGLGERFADEYYGEADKTHDAAFRGVACYFWDSLATAHDPGLRLAIQFARPPKGERILGPLYLGRYRSSPPSPFA